MWMENFVYQKPADQDLHSFQKRKKGNLQCRLIKLNMIFYFMIRERSGSVVECLTRDQEAAGSSLDGVTALWFLSKTHLS